MKTFFTIALLSIFTAISAQEIQKEVKIETALETVTRTEQTEVSGEATQEVTEEVARLFKRRNSLIKRELKLYTRAQRSKLA